MDDKSIMKFEATLPENFDGTFRFTNWSDEDFTAKWGSKEYTFPANSTSPMLIPEHSPIEIQHIRKKFAQNLAEREFFKSQQYQKQFISQERNPDGSPRLNGIHQAGTYNINMLAPMIQRCLEPLPVTSARVIASPTEPIENKLTRTEDGELVTEVVDKNTSLKKKALNK